MSETTITKADVQARVYSALEEFGADADAIAPDATFEALDVDSLDLVEVVKALEDRYEIQIADGRLKAIANVADAVALVQELVGEREGARA